MPPTFWLRIIFVAEFLFNSPRLIIFSDPQTRITVFKAALYPLVAKPTR